MTRRFVKETAYADFIIPSDSVIKTWLTALINSQDSFIILSDGDSGIAGAMGFSIVPHFLDGKQASFELFWWVEPEHRGVGGELFRFYEQFIINRGVGRSFCVAPEGKGATIASFYERQGYSKFETTFVKEL
jgi:hypothetical protein